ncbi:hypothetical protein SEVIR_3G246900v4 [Setaria viridis]|uniref:DUF7795 domain-containing protein n=2 Tax=Setaria TaxID=4554 RepID=A0A368QID8_SETIT|nr:uncharacterized protein LOC101772671 isoform X1 [Setaria italica]XP_034584736.1 uncharacterized protein LOC117847612 isoform X1 [Setaria viridis]XP_034584737.1 uncharacterized protein LOC117847612 isoform X1 [Setaria viridis]RCV17709.1 hypothetical protein SETIT_3G241100v2 [Setaria italica]TKW27269.1 hypothetical protein SEVIR_3G246900v2 [Setaria viridis]
MLMVDMTSLSYCAFVFRTEALLNMQDSDIHSCEDGLKDHINKVKTLLEELECLVEDVYAITLTANISALKVSDSHTIDSKLTIDSCIIGVEVSVQTFPFTNHLHSVLFNREYLAVYNDEVRWKPGNMLHLLQEDKSADQLDSDVFLVTVMIIVHNMLELDYAMQENIVGALSLKTLPSELEGYCLMWDLRPYIDDDVMHLAWEMCP